MPTFVRFTDAYSEREGEYTSTVINLDFVREVRVAPFRQHQDQQDRWLALYMDRPVAAYIAYFGPLSLTEEEITARLESFAFAATTQAITSGEPMWTHDRDRRKQVGTD